MQLVHNRRSTCCPDNAAFAVRQCLQRHISICTQAVLCHRCGLCSNSECADLAISVAVVMIDSKSAEPSMTAFLLRNQPLQHATADGHCQTRLGTTPQTIVQDCFFGQQAADTDLDLQRQPKRPIAVGCQCKQHHLGPLRLSVTLSIVTGSKVTSTSLLHHHGHRAQAAVGQQQLHAVTPLHKWGIADRGAGRPVQGIL